MIVSLDHFDFIISVSILSFTVLSFILNFITIYILSRPKFLKESIFRYFLVNEVFATVGLVLSWLYLVPKINNWDVPLIFCQLFSSMLHILYNFYPWISVLNSIDRLLSLKYQGDFKFIKKFKYQFLALSLIFISSFLINIPRFFYAGFSNVTLCFINDLPIALYLDIESLFISIVVPFFIMFLSTIIIIHYMITQKRRLQQNLINYKREKDFVRSVLTMDLWFLLCYSPFSFSELYQIYYGSNNNVNLKIFVSVAQFLLMFEMSFNFLIYLVCNKQFRKYFLSITCCFRKNSRRPTNVYR